MRESIKQFAKIAAETLPISDPIYEFGYFQVPGQEELADLRPLFPDKKYIGADLREGPGVDIVLNLHDINLPSESAGTAFCLDTLEHVEYPRKAIDELHRVLKQNGMLIISSSMNFPIHDFPYDFWRFTPDAFKSLLKPFTQSFVDFAGDNEFPHTVVGVGFKGTIPGNGMNKLAERIKPWKESCAIVPKKSWKRLLKITVSPIRFAIYRRISKG